MIELKKLPIGIQTFSDLILNNCLYVDKTASIHRLIKEKGVYFFSRPRRFGKSLLLSTIKAIFEGKRELFKGLAIDTMEYNWTIYPVISISLSNITYKSDTGLHESLQDMLLDIAHDHGVTIEPTNSASRLLIRLVKQVSQKHKQQVVVLIDEYDKPILDALNNTTLAKKVRQELHDFYVVLKDLDEYLQFLFLTGVSRFARTSIFSGLNQLEDISFEKENSSLCGYTDEEIDHYFANYLSIIEPKKEARMQIREKIKAWYDGYLFHHAGKKVYNPFSILNFFKQKEFKNYWFATGTPTFLLDLIKQQHFNLLSHDALLLPSPKMSDLTIENLDCVSVLYQTGYITIDHYDEDSDTYRLRIANIEVKRSLFGALLENCIHGAAYTGIYALMGDLKRATLNNQLDSVIEYLKIMYAKIPYTVNIAQERYYQTIFYTIFLLAGFDIIVEEATNEGRIDVVITTPTHRYIIELKLDKTATEALQQIKDKRYAVKYSDDQRAIILIGINFASEKRTITEYIIELGEK